MRRHSIVVGALWALAGFLVIMGIVLIREYRFYRVQGAQLVELKAAYCEQKDELDKLVQDYKTRDEAATAGEETSDKKKSSDDDELGVAEFPLGVRIVSSDDDLEYDQGAFLVLNRDTAYLRQSAVDYLSEHRCDCAIYDDTYSIIQEREEPEPAVGAGTKKQKKRKKKQVVARKPAKRHYASFEPEGVHERVLSWPIEGRGKQFWLSSLYGPRRKPNGTWALHGGIDMAAVRGTPVHPAAPGVILEARYDSGWGKTILVEHNHKYKTRYAHLDAILVSPGQHVTKQTVIGRVGRTGNVRSRHGDPSHLHFEVYAFGKKINPLYVLGA